MSTNKYTIWSEGFNTTGHSGKAIVMAHDIEASSFEEACLKAFKDDKFFDEKNLTYWGCRLFDNETEARESFG